jgi:hypothetical protein
MDDFGILMRQISALKRLIADTDPNCSAYSFLQDLLQKKNLKLFDSMCKTDSPKSKEFLQKDK